MPERPLPLDDARYREYVERLRALVEADPELEDVERVRRFVEDHRDSFGPRTAAATASAPDEHLRALVRVMVLAASELSDLHADSRRLLAERGAVPPWDVAAPRSPRAPIRLGVRVVGVVEWEPARRVELDPELAPPERHWATALAVGLGERPQWSEQELWSYAAYLVLGTESFGELRALSDAELAERFCVPLEAVRHRRALPDAL